MLFVGDIVFLLFLGWIDWRLKRRKIIKENKMTDYIAGYAILDIDSVESGVWVLSGLLGVNSEELVFGHCFKDDAMYFPTKISDIGSIEISEYDENSFLSFIRRWRHIHDDTVKYIVVNMAGVSTGKRIPKLVRTRMLCNVSAGDGGFLFCFKGTAENVELIDKIKKYAQCIDNRHIM